MHEKMRDEILAEAMQLGIKFGIEKAIETMEKIKQEKCKQRFDRRLRNIELLLKNYRNFKIHVKDAIGDSLKQRSLEVFEEFETFEYDEQLYIDAIKKSKERTAIMVKHIDNMLDMYKAIAQVKKKDDIRKYNVIEALYISDEEKNVSEIAKDLHIDRATVFRYKNEALESLTVLIFGIDGLKV